MTAQSGSSREERRADGQCLLAAFRSDDDGANDPLAASRK